MFFHFSIKVRLDEQRELGCAGTLLTANFVLTAGHCAPDNQGTMVVGYGDNDLPVANVIRHPSYRKEPTNVFNDFCLVKLANPIENFSTFVCLPGNDTDQFVGYSMTASGWGYTSFQDKTFSTVLKSVDLAVIGNPECTTALGVAMNSDQLCAVDSSGQSSVCSGDSGGKYFPENVLF